ncbi:MAG: purine-nucleoside phosphorylase [Erysipelotrichaceae bacterium]
MENYYGKIQACAEVIRSKCAYLPETALILGSGLGDIVDQLEETTIFPYDSLPHFPQSTVSGHKGQLILGKLRGKAVLVMQGRVHYYEGYTMQEVVFPIYVFKALGISTLILTNACGGINESYQPGDIVLVDDFINLAFDNPLFGVNDERLGPRFPDMSEPFNLALIEQVKSNHPELKQGIYGFFSGPYYETKAEIQAFKRLGCDLIGMSTVPETIAANHCGMKVLAFSVVTNMATGIQKVKHDHQRVVATAHRAAGNLQQILMDFLV